jgi:pyruvate,water dikinase
MPLRSLDELAPADRARVGGKAWNCARLKQLGLPVPDALVVPADANAADIAALDCDPWFDRCPPDARFAVRSSGLDEDSADQSFAGVHETRLDVARVDLSAAVLACRASANSDRARAYRESRHTPADAGGVGVLIQRMVRPIASGVAFTIDPVTGASGEMVINATRGLGVAVVDGTVEPDEIRVRKTDGQVASYAAGGERSLSDADVQALWRLLVEIEREYGTPQDVEWCRDERQFWIVQSRPITTARPAHAAGPDVEWTRANLAEVLPELTSPQALAAIEQMLNVSQRRYMGHLLAPYDELGPMVKSFCGRMYFNLSQMRRVCYITRTPTSRMLRSIGHAGSMGAEDEPVPWPPIRLLIPCLPDFVRILSRHLRAARLYRGHAAMIDAVIARLAPIDPNALSDEQLWAEIMEWERRSPETIEIVFLFSGVLYHELGLQKICRAVDFPFERLLYSQLAAGERSVSAQQAFDLVALADSARAEPRAAEWLAQSGARAADLRTMLAGTNFLSAFDRFLERYGHRGVYESDWSLPRYRDDPSPILQALALHLRSGPDDSRAAAVARVEAEASEILADFAHRLTALQRWTMLPRARVLLKKIKHYYLWRERVRSDMVRVAAVLRQWHLVLARRFVERGWIGRTDDYFFLLLDEIGTAVAHRGSSDLRDRIKARRAEAEWYRPIQMPLLMRESEVARVTAGAAGASAAPDAILAANDEMRGTPVSRGSVEADVVVITDPADFASMRRGAILVTRATDPSWTPLFTLASGVIVEVGGVLSHASTIAREYGLPALANVKHATRRLKTGDRVVLNATEGFVRKAAAPVA